jgi:hypothetical protein
VRSAVGMRGAIAVVGAETIATRSGVGSRHLDLEVSSSALLCVVYAMCPALLRTE